MTEAEAAEIVSELMRMELLHPGKRSPRFGRLLNTKLDTIEAADAVLGQLLHLVAWLTKGYTRGLTPAERAEWFETILIPRLRADALLKDLSRELTNPGDPS